ncbi:MJ1255/VC2487 family glycosyltransferase [Vibrio cholerae]|uniref:Glycosyltransferase n=1 Tax=Vibrio paracholerae TaxID=650003 RepID=A0ABD7FT56_9VIBR|nr:MULTISPECIES: MJ1255/VC2487 family glycosyltransferase [Vibrio]EGQ9393291.1 glycosyltransferase [Vibrio cholerae]EGR1860537.1 glycosyltransferase [Vibrio cholerae]EJL6330158.1 glycosyltransferase [Vibrio cholerae]EJO4031342.1 glycosyltransferase [Vibrio cholerae]EKG0408901.1 glycosyltransferase [Vibrio cholerae]
MKILYGVQGTGNGHIARSRAMCAALKQQQVDVDYLFSGRPVENYFSMECFGDFATRRGLTFATENGHVNYVKTLRKNNLLQFWNEVKRLDLSGYDLILNDFEPVTAWAAKLQNIPCIGISHQNAFLYPVPLKGASWLDKAILRHFAPAQYHLGLHWYHFEQPILPPIIYTPEQPLSQQNFILVYLPFENVNEICELLYRFTNIHFICYHPEVPENELTENVELRRLHHGDFQHHLHQCSGVITSGGFELPSEALALGKKLLMKPLVGQFEQVSNAATLETLGLASVMEFLDPACLRQWLDEKQAERVIYPDVAHFLVEWILKGKWENSEVLCQQLWQKVDFPSYAILGNELTNPMSPSLKHF